LQHGEFLLRRAGSIGAGIDIEAIGIDPVRPAYDLVAFETEGRTDEQAEG